MLTRYAVRVDDGVETAARLMIDEDIHRAVVMNDGSIAGIVSPLDVLRALVRHDASQGEPPCRLKLEYVDLREMP